MQTELPILEEEEMQILMHCHAHFGGSFSLMQEYYEEDGVGCQDEFEHIQDLGYTLDILPMPQQQAVERAQKLYLDLRAVYEQDHPLPKAISDLILSEEEYPEAEIDALVYLGEIAIPALKDLITSSTFQDPLNPGYGRVLPFAARALARITPDIAIPLIFSQLGHEDFFVEDSLISTLQMANAQDFLLKRLKSLPFTQDNLLAARALSAFPEHPAIQQAAKEQLTNSPAEPLLSYLKEIVETN